MNTRDKQYMVCMVFESFCLRGSFPLFAGDHANHAEYAAAQVNRT